MSQNGKIQGTLHKLDEVSKIEHLMILNDVASSGYFGTISIREK